MQHLTLSFSDLNAHLLTARLQLTLTESQSIVLQLPRWIPGSYLLRDFAKNISITSVTDGQGNYLTIDRLDLGRWQLQETVGTVYIDYQIYAFDASVRACYVTAHYAFVNPAACALFVSSWRDQAYTLTLLQPTQSPTWSVHTTLESVEVDQQGYGDYQAVNYDDLIEHPLLIGDAIVVDFDVAGIEHRLVLVDEAPLEHLDTTKLSADLSAICLTEQTFWQQNKHPLPFQKYLFQVMVSSDGYGGLEHINSTALMTSRASLPRMNQTPTKPYEDFLGLCAHEYFHVWLVKRIKPAGLIRPELNDAVITPLLWIFEGVTSLYDDWMLLRSQRITTATLLNRWSDSLTRTLTTAGAAQQSLADASREAWIKFYQPNENSANSQVSYYTRGMATALLLQCTLNEHGLHLDRLLHHWWQNWQDNPSCTLSPTKLLSDLQQLFPDMDWLAWLTTHVEQPNPHLADQLASQLPALGLVLSAKYQPSLGTKLAEEQGMLIVKQVHYQGPGHLAGLQVGDELLSINGWRVRTPAQVEQQLAVWQANTVNQPLSIHYTRKGRLMQTDALPTFIANRFELSALSQQSLTWLMP